jgi:hypothetical protein
MESFEGTPGLNGPPKATLARRAKSYSDFYDAAIGYLGKQAEHEKIVDSFEVSENTESRSPFEIRYEKCEDNLLDTSQGEYQYVYLIPLQKMPH